MLIAYESVILQPNGRLMNDNKRHYDMFSQATDIHQISFIFMWNKYIFYPNSEMFIKCHTEMRYCYPSFVVFIFIPLNDGRNKNTQSENINIINHKSKAAAHTPSLFIKPHTPK